MTKRILKASLPMGPPGRIMISDLVKASICTCLYGTGNEAVRIITKYFYPGFTASFRLSGYSDQTKINGIRNMTLTGCPRCNPGVHFGDSEITLTASLSSKG
jgi:hypothetical protein